MSKKISFLGLLLSNSDITRPKLQKLLGWSKQRMYSHVVNAAGPTTALVSALKKRVSKKDLSKLILDYFDL